MVVVEVRQRTMGVDGRGWGPAGHTWRGYSRLRSGRERWAWMVAVEVRQGTLGVDTRGWGPAENTWPCYLKRVRVFQFACYLQHDYRIFNLRNSCNTSEVSNGESRQKIRYFRSKKNAEKEKTRNRPKNCQKMHKKSVKNGTLCLLFLCRFYFWLDVFFDCCSSLFFRLHLRLWHKPVLNMWSIELQFANCHSHTKFESITGLPSRTFQM